MHHIKPVVGKNARLQDHISEPYWSKPISLTFPIASGFAQVNNNRDTVIIVLAIRVDDKKRLGEKSLRAMAQPLLKKMFNELKF